MKLFKFFFLIILYNLTYANEKALEVPLSTENSFVPVYLVASGSQDRETAELYDALRFDLNQNGYVQVFEKDGLRDALFDLDVRKIFDSELWKNHPAQYFVKVQFFSLEIHATIFDAKSKQIKHYEKILFSHDESKDRKKIHRLADKILWDVARKKGIASLQILFCKKVPNPSSKGSKWISEIWISDYDGKNAKQITFDRHYAVHPLFFPKQKKGSKEILFVSYLTGQPKIYRKDCFTTKPSESMIPLPGNQLLPSLSMSGTALSFICDVAGRPDLFLQPLKNFEILGKPKQLFSFPRATQASSTFSPDGKRVAFVSDKDGSPRIYQINIPNDHEQKRPDAKLLTKVNRQNVSPAWSPDGKKIAFSALTDGIRQIWIYDMDEEREWQLTFGPEHKENPAWAGDSFHLLYNTEDPNSSELYLINLQKKESIQISQGFGKKRFPSWEPL